MRKHGVIHYRVLSGFLLRAVIHFNCTEFDTYYQVRKVTFEDWFIKLLHVSHMVLKCL